MGAIYGLYKRYIGAMKGVYRGLGFTPVGKWEGSSSHGLDREQPNPFK